MQRLITICASVISRISPMYNINHIYWRIVYREKGTADLGAPRSPKVDADMHWFSYWGKCLDMFKISVIIR